MAQRAGWPDEMTNPDMGAMYSAKGVLAFASGRRWRVRTPLLPRLKISCTFARGVAQASTQTLGRPGRQC